MNSISFSNSFFEGAIEMRETPLEPSVKPKSKVSITATCNTRT